MTETALELQEKLRKIDEEIKSVVAELSEIGDDFIDVIIDSRADNDLPPLTPEELEAAKAECDKNAEKALVLEARHLELTLAAKEIYDALELQRRLEP